MFSLGACYALETPQVPQNSPRKIGKLCLISMSQKIKTIIDFFALSHFVILPIDPLDKQLKFLPKSYSTICEKNSQTWRNYLYVPNEYMQQFLSLAMAKARIIIKEDTNGFQGTNHFYLL